MESTIERLERQLENAKRNRAFKEAGGFRHSTEDAGPCVCASAENHDPPCLGPDCDCHG